MTSLVKGRLASAAVALAVGPPVAGFLLGVMALPVNAVYPLHPSIGLNRDLLSGALGYAFGAFFISPPVVGTALLIGWLFFTRGDTIPLRAVLASALLALLCGGMVLALLNGGFAKASDMPAVAVVFIVVAVPVLASAAFCWWITRRWHSPEATP